MSEADGTGQDRTVNRGMREYEKTNKAYNIYYVKYWS